MTARSGAKKPGVAVKWRLSIAGRGSEWSVRFSTISDPQPARRPEPREQQQDLSQDNEAEP
ncbi:MAG TPA: hypothetical protein VLJ39_15380, partial [Tepidisphaeraceae bacterium]|nr:hypothetical protein [Tepidisphaeraceae bacterium]